MRSLLRLPTVPFALGLAAAGASAESFPAHPARIVIGPTAGGGIDLVARIIAKHGGGVPQALPRRKSEDGRSERR